jgi:hypothetical protein
MSRKTNKSQQPNYLERWTKEYSDKKTKNFKMQNVAKVRTRARKRNLQEMIFYEVFISTVLFPISNYNSQSIKITVGIVKY